VDTTSAKKKFRLLNPEVHTPSFYGSWLLLMGFWILITWTLNYQSLLVGLVASYGLTRFNRSLIIVPSERFFLNKETVRLSLRYAWLMLVAIIKANIDVAVIVLQRRMPISPGIVKFKTNIRRDFNRVILANSITLTPGTLTIDMEDDVYVIHCLTRANADDVCQWNMEQELFQIESKGS
jgi:multicomponent Na+:H+ antiporter subunit E